MKLVFDDGAEQEIGEEDFYKILVRAESMSERKKNYYKELADTKLWDPEYLKISQLKDIEERIHNITLTLERLYF